MARWFDDGSSQCLYSPATYSLSFPVSMACWFQADDAALAWCAMAAGDASGSYYVGIQVRGDIAGDPIYAVMHCPEGTRVAESTTGFTVGTWHHALAVFAAVDDRRIYLDGGSKDTDVVSGTAPTMSRVSIAVTPDSTPWGYGSGGIAEPVLWDVALTDGEAAALALGISPTLVRPDHLVSYWPLLRAEDLDRVGGYHLTDYNTPTVATHPPLAGWFPAPRMYHLRAPAGPDLSIAVVPTDSGYYQRGVKIG